MTATLDNFESVLKIEYNFCVRLNFESIAHKISRALARKSVLAHADFVLRRESI